MSAQLYRAAFIKFLKEPKHFDFKKDEFGSSYLAQLDNRIYRISRFDDIKKDSLEKLTCKEQAFTIPVSVWVELVEDIHTQSDFHWHLINGLDSELSNSLNLAINLSLISDNPPDSFWNALYLTDQIDLYGHAIVAAAQMRDLDALAEYLTEILLENGFENFNDFRDGVFETIDLDEDDPDGDLFYIYTVDDVEWE